MLSGETGAWVMFRYKILLDLWNFIILNLEALLIRRILMFRKTAVLYLILARKEMQSFKLLVGTVYDFLSPFFVLASSHLLEILLVIIVRASIFNYIVLLI